MMIDLWLSPWRVHSVADERNENGNYEDDITLSEYVTNINENEK